MEEKNLFQPTDNLLKTSTFKDIEHYCLQYNLLPERSTIIVGLSGGPDSIFLLHYLQSLQSKYHLTLISAHLNHGWRTTSDNDQTFCKQVSKNLKIPFVTDYLKNFALDKSTGSQEADARYARRQFFTQTKKDFNADFIALGHHAQDQQETFFIRLIRGATLSGLCSMKSKNDDYIRPLLQTSKQDIVTLLKDNDITFIEDETNSSPNFLRNRIRHSVIPALQEVDKRSAHNCLRTINNLQEDQKLLEEYTQQTLKKLLITKDNQQWLSCTKLQQLHPALQKRVLIQWLISYKVSLTLTTSFLQEIFKFINSPHGGTHKMHTTWSVIKKHNNLQITLI